MFDDARRDYLLKADQNKTRKSSIYLSRSPVSQQQVISTSLC